MDFTGAKAVKQSSRLAELGVAQTTLKRAVSCTGIGLHNGHQIRLSLHPAAANSGIVFRRVDLPGTPVIPARYDRVSDLVLCTTLAVDDVKVATVEHLLAALAGLGIDNARVDVDGPEVPVMDGSSAPFVGLIEQAGTLGLSTPRRYIRILAPIEVRDGNRVARLEPGYGFSVAVAIDFDSAAVGRQAVEVELDDGAFKAELASARTFGFAHEVQQLQAMGLARGGSLDNAVVIDGDRILNDGGLRFGDEFARHKALDALGDLYLAGAPIIGRFHGERSGHALNNRLLHELFAQPESWCFASHAVALPTHPEMALAAAE